MHRYHRGIEFPGALYQVMARGDGCAAEEDASDESHSCLSLYTPVRRSTTVSTHAVLLPCTVTVSI